MKRFDELGISPAPWTATADADGEIMVNDENRHGIAACGHTAEGDVNFANARLIAAAPELYGALREAINKYCYDCGGDECMRSGRCAYAWHKHLCCVTRWRKALEKAGGAE